MPRSLLSSLPFLLCGLMSLHAWPTYPHQHDGPQIIVLSPHEGDTVRTPFDLDVRFLASPDAHIALETLKIEVKKMLLDVDVTERVKQFANSTGIHMTQADFPKGHHTVTLQIADELGRVTAKTVTMDVQ